MKKFFTYSAIVSLFAAMLAFSGCGKEEVEVNPLGEGFSFSGMAPNPVMRGGSLLIFGHDLDKVSEVVFAGDVTVTEFLKVSKGAKLDTLELTVPVEGPEVGKVTIVSKSGTKLSSFSELTFTEPIEVESFAPATVLSGDVLTFTGEYLNVVKEVIFSGDDALSTEFESQSRHELKVKVPANAITGPVILSDVNEIEDQNTIPNHVYTKTDLTVGKPTVVKAAKATYKSGDVITVKGEHLDMIKNVALPQVDEVEFTVSEDAKTITFNLDRKATDGNITLTSFAGDNFDAGEIETVSVTELSVKSLAEDGRFKAGVDVEISGEDLDLVTKVEFEGAEADWYLDGKKIIATQPDTAKDGAITVTLDSGKQAFSEDLVVVKPEILAWETVMTLTAGESTITIEGTDLDLVSSVKMGDKAQGFIDCEFEFVGDTDEPDVKVSIPAQAYTGPIIFTSAAGYETETDPFVVEYNMAVSISFDKPVVGLGDNIVISGKNLLQIEQVFIKGKKVTSFAARTDTSMSFGIPDKLGPGVYRLDLVLVDGTEMTWPIPFEITAPFTETFIWEGNEPIAWNGMSALSWGGYDWSTVEEGTVLCAHFVVNTEAGTNVIRFGNGSWQSLPSLAGLAQDGNIPLDASMSEYKFELTAADLNALRNEGGLVMTGDGYTLTGVSLIVFGASESRNTIWEGSVAVDWSGATPGAEGSMGALSWGGYDWSTVEPGTVLALAFERTADEVQIRLGNGSWSALPGTEDPYKPEGDELKVELTADMIAELVANGGLVITGQGYTLTEVALVTTGAAASFGETIWEGSVAVDWSGATPGAEGSMGALSWGGYDWSTVEAGTVLVLEFERTADEVQIRLGNGSWNALPGTEDPYKPEGDSLEVELSADMIADMVANGGLVITGQGYTLTAVILK